MPPFFPEGLYTLRPKDFEGIQLEPYYQFEQPPGVAAAGLTFNVIPPRDRAIVLQHAFIVATPGAGQNVTQMQFDIFQFDPPTGIFIQRGVLKIVPTPSPVAQLGVLEWVGSILVPQNWTFRMNTTFNAGANQNFHNITLVGALIPPGNLPRL